MDANANPYPSLTQDVENMTPCELSTLIRQLEGANAAAKLKQSEQLLDELRDKLTRTLGKMIFGPGRD